MLLILWGNHNTPFQQMQVCLDRAVFFPDVDEKFGGRLNSLETQMHINALELSVILYSLRTTSSEMSGVHIRIMTDNITTKLLIQNQGLVCLFSVIQLQDKYGLGQLNVIFGFERHIYQVYQMKKRMMLLETLMMKLNGHYLRTNSQ